MTRDCTKFGQTGIHPLFAIVLIGLPLVLSLGANVSTSNGLIIGHQAYDTTGVFAWLGVPYAQPPVGSLRFAAPEKLVAHGSKSFVASNFLYPKRNARALADLDRRSCPVPPPSPSKPFPGATNQSDKIIAAFTGSVDNHRGEDCLTLNIWSKDSSTNDKAVVVFFYGGRYTTGTTNTPFYNGQHLADAEDIIVVTVNFRINIFGFPGAPNTTKNVGLLDQRLAVEWVRDNIHAFGGDANRIVISGQSSGAAAVDYWSYAYADDPIVHGFIQNSGNVFTFGNNDNDLASSHWYNVSSQLGCGDSGDTLPCMRAIRNFSAIESAAAKVKPPPGNPGRPSPVFQPTPDNITIFADYKIRAEAGNFARLPFLVGQNNNEAGYYKITAYSQGVALDSVDWDRFNLETFTCPIVFASANRVRLNVPTYRFVYYGDWDNLRLYPSSGAYHTSDINMVLGVSQDVSGLPSTPQQKQMEMTFMRAWGAFARDPKNGLSKVLEWPMYGPNGTTLASLGYDNDGNLTLTGPDSYDSACSNVTISG